MIQSQAVVQVETKDQRELKILQQKFSALEKQQQETISKHTVVQIDLRKALEEMKTLQKELDQQKDLVKDFQNQIKILQEKNAKETAAFNLQLEYFKQNDPNALKLQAKASIKELTAKHQKEIKLQQEETEAQIAALNQEITTLTQDLKIRQHEFNDQEKLLKCVLDNQNKDLTGIQQELMSVKNQNEALNIQMKQKQDKMNEMFQTIQNQETIISGKQQELKRLHNTLAQQQQINEQKFTEMQHTNETQQNTIMMFQKEINDMKTNAIIVEKQYQENERKLITDTETTQARYERDQQKNTEEYIRNLNHHLKQIDILKKELTKVRMNYKSQTEEHKQLQAEHSQATKMIQQLRINYSEEILALNKSHEEQLKQIQQDQETKESSLSIQPEKLAYLHLNEIKVDQTTAYKLEKAKLLKTIQELETTNKLLLQTRSENEQKIKELGQQLNKVKFSLDPSTDSLLAAQIKQQKIIIEQLQSDNASLKQNLEQKSLFQALDITDFQPLSKPGSQQLRRRSTSTLDDSSSKQQLAQKDYVILQMKKQIKDLEIEVEQSQMKSMLPSLEKKK
ncbi:Hypothetical_protein [Hexamita inflata]|uniref:Hypothetical_protein n=1 Tax=Hexamita inflata TaxID=28002 RepID=A0AA86RI10_9EUKA|nr:Hypothetical protein HINF_LOCUS65900 [Hexamita inflata]